MAFRKNPPPQLPPRPDNSPVSHLMYYHPYLRDLSDVREVMLPYVMQDGAFLLRNSSKKKDTFTVSVMHDKSIKHFYIFRRETYFYLQEDKFFGSVDKLISHYKYEDVPNMEGIKHIRLLHPIRNPHYQTNGACASESPRRATPPSPHVEATPPVPSAREPYTYSPETKETPKSAKKQKRHFFFTLPKSSKRDSGSYANLADSVHTVDRKVTPPHADKSPIKPNGHANHDSGQSQDPDAAQSGRGRVSRDEPPEQNEQKSSDNEVKQGLSLERGRRKASSESSSGRSPSSQDAGQSQVNPQISDPGRVIGDATSGRNLIDRAPPPLPTGHITDSKLYYSSVHDTDISRISALLKSLQTDNDRAKCDCGLYFDEAELPLNWTMHISHDPGTKGRVFFMGPSGQTAWNLPLEVACELSQGQQERIRVLLDKYHREHMKPIAVAQPRLRSVSDAESVNDEAGKSDQASGFSPNAFSSPDYLHSEGFRDGGEFSQYPG